MSRRENWPIAEPNRNVTATNPSRAAADSSSRAPGPTSLPSAQVRQPPDLQRRHHAGDAPPHERIAVKPGPPYQVDQLTPNLLRRQAEEFPGAGRLDV